MIATQTIECRLLRSCVVPEAIWTGTLAIGFDTLKPGEKAEALEVWGEHVTALVGGSHERSVESRSQTKGQLAS
ncbi:MAG: hypothetical protein WBW37_03040 [Methyloceanibacter sp.]